MGLWVNEGLEDLHKQLLAAATLGEPSTAALFTNNHTPVPTSVIGDFTIDVSTHTTITPGSWVFTPDPANNRDQAQYVIDFDLSLLGGNTYWGVVLFNAAATTLYWAQVFPTAFVVPPAGVNPFPFLLLDYRKDCST